MFEFILTSALSILRSGHCSGNLINNLSEFAIEALKLDITTLLEIANLSPKRNDYFSMESNDVDKSSLEVYNTSEALTFMAVLRLRDIEDSIKLIGKQIPVDWREHLETRMGQYSKRAYLRSRELYSKDCILTEKEEEDIFKEVSYNVKRIKSYVPPTRFDKENLRTM